MKISVCIPTYEMKGLGQTFLKHSFDILSKQTYKNFDVVISDHSKTNDIKDLCNQYKDIIQINYFRNENSRGNSSANINNAIKNADGDLIKILFQDDFLYDENALENIDKDFDVTKDKWMVSACTHSKDGKSFFDKNTPVYNDNIHLGANTISSPSVVTIINDDPILFDENLIWRMDSDYYKRCYIKYGAPKILNNINVVNRVGSHQITNTIANNNIRDDEYIYLLKKYNEKWYITSIILMKIKKYLRYIKNLIKK